MAAAASGNSPLPLSFTQAYTTPHPTFKIFIITISSLPMYHKKMLMPLNGVMLLSELVVGSAKDLHIM